MVPIVSIVGRSGSGKTTLIEGLIPLLKRRGYRIGTMKHGIHGSDLDLEGKDSWRHARAGAEASLIALPQGLGIFRKPDEEKGVEELAEAYLWDMDLVLAEGFKGERIPKIEIHRSELGKDLMTRGDGHLVAVVTDAPLSLQVPRFSLDDHQPLADFVEERFLRRREREEVELVVDGRRVVLKPFVRDLFLSLVRAMVAPLKGVSPFTHLVVRLHSWEDPETAGQ